jgi:type II secretory pathway component PulF
VSEAVSNNLQGIALTAAAAGCSAFVLHDKIPLIAFRFQAAGRAVPEGLRFFISAGNLVNSWGWVVIVLAVVLAALSRFGKVALPFWIHAGYGTLLVGWLALGHALVGFLATAGLALP